MTSLAITAAEMSPSVIALVVALRNRQLIRRFSEQLGDGLEEPG